MHPVGVAGIESRSFEVPGRGKLFSCISAVVGHVVVAAHGVVRHFEVEDTEYQLKEAAILRSAGVCFEQTVEVFECIDNFDMCVFGHMHAVFWIEDRSTGALLKKFLVFLQLPLVTTRQLAAFFFQLAQTLYLAVERIHCEGCRG